MGSVAGIVIEAQVGKEIAPRLAQLAARLAYLTPVMEDIGAILERNVQLRFDTKADPSGRLWKPLVASTRVAYAKAGVGGSLLERTRLMRESLNSQAGKDSVVIGFGRPPADGRSHAGILDPTSRSAGSPRKSACVGWWDTCVRCFNEAAAIRRGNRPTSPCARGTPSRFNEAAAIRRGNPMRTAALDIPGAKLQ